METIWCLWRGFLKDLGERGMGGGRPHVLLKHPCGLWNSKSWFSASAGSWPLWQEPTGQSGLIKNYRGGQQHWKWWVVWKYLTCFLCFQEQLLWQLTEDWVLLCFRGLAVMHVWRGYITYTTKLCSLQPSFFMDAYATLELTTEILLKTCYLNPHEGIY